MLIKENISGIIFVITLLLVSSCADVSDGTLENPSPDVVSRDDLSTTAPEVFPDSDGDGIIDKNDEDPLISSFPRIVVTESINTKMSWKINRDFGLVSKDFSLNNRVDSDFRQIKSSVIRTKLVSSVFDKIIDPDSDTITGNLIQFDDFNIFPMSEWSAFDSLVARHLLDQDIAELMTSDIETNFKLRLENINDVTEISQIKVELGFLDRVTNTFEPFHTTRLTSDGNNLSIFVLDGKQSTLESQIEFKIRDQFAPLSVVADGIENEKKLAIRIKDFEYVRKGVRLQYSHVLDDVNDKTARFIISDDKRTDLLHIVPTKSILEHFKSLREAFLISASRTILGASHSRSHLPNTLFVNDTDLHKLQPDELDHGLWKTIPISTNIDSMPVSGGVYSLIYSRAKNIVSSQKDRMDFFEENVTSLRNLSTYSFGDEVILEVSAKQIEPFIIQENGSANISYEYCENFDPAREFDKRRHCWMHTENSLITRDSIQYREVPLYIGESYQTYLKVILGELDLFYTNNYSVYLIDGKLYIKTKITENEVSYKNVISIEPIDSLKTLETGFVRFHDSSVPRQRKFVCNSGCERIRETYNNKTILEVKQIRFGNINQ